MSQLKQLAKTSDKLFEAYKKELRDAGRVAGVRIDPRSVKLIVGKDMRLATATSRDLGKACCAQSEPFLGMIHASGRLGGDIPKPGAYAVRQVRVDAQRYAGLVSAEGIEVARVPLKISVRQEPNALVTGYCDSGAEIGEGYACVSFECCNDLVGCISNNFCFAL